MGQRPESCAGDAVVEGASTTATSKDASNLVNLNGFRRKAGSPCDIKRIMKTTAFVPIRLNSQSASASAEPSAERIAPLYTPRTDAEVEGNRRDLRLLRRRADPRVLPEGVRFLRRSEELDRDTTLGRVPTSHRRGRSRPLCAGARHVALYPRRDRRGCSKWFGRIRLGIQRRAGCDVRMVRGGRSTIRPKTSPHADHRGGVSKPAPSSSSRRRLWTGRHRRIGDRPWRLWTVSSWTRMTSTIGISRWPRSSPQSLQPRQIPAHLPASGDTKRRISIPPFRSSNSSGSVHRRRHRTAGAVDDPRTERGIIAQDFVAAEQFGDFGQMVRHRIGHMGTFL